MPREPLVVLHTALCDVIPETVKGIEEAEKRIVEKTKLSSTQTNMCEIKAAIFYSIAATQKGLQVSFVMFEAIICYYNKIINSFIMIIIAGNRARKLFNKRGSERGNSRISND